MLNWKVDIQMRSIVTPLYTAEAKAVGGRAGKVCSSDGVLDLPLERPKGMGGEGKPGTNPEQLFAAAYSACFESAVRFICHQEKLTLGSCSVTAQVTIGKAEDQGFALAARLIVSLPDLSKERAHEVVERAHQTCPFSHATRGNIAVELSVAD
jgi:osmotically inducible protein OsmC